MAEEVTGVVSNVTTETHTPKTGTSTYEMTTVTLGDITGRGFTNKLGVLPNVGDSISMKYQPVNSGKKDSDGKPIIYNTILSVDVLPFAHEGSSTVSTVTPVKPKTVITKEVKPMRDKAKFFKIKGKAFFAHVKEPDTKGKYPTNKFKLDLSVDAATKVALTKLGVLVKNKDDTKKDFVTLKSSFQPTVVDENGLQLSEIPLIGNGSEITVTVATYENKAPQGGKTCLGMNRIEIHSLVHYEAPNLLDLDSSEG